MFSLSTIGQDISHGDVQKIRENADPDEYICAGGGRWEGGTQLLEAWTRSLHVLSGRTATSIFPPCLSFLTGRTALGISGALVSPVTRSLSSLS